MKYAEAKPYLKEGMKIRFKQGEWKYGIVTRVKNGCFIQGRYCVPTNLSSDFYWSEDGRDFEFEILTNPNGSKWVHPDKRKIAVRCTNKAEWSKVVGRALSEDFIWGGSRDKTLREDLCRESDQCVSLGDGEIWQSATSYYESQGYKILSAGEYLGEKIEEPKTAREVILSGHRAGKNFFYDEGRKYYSVPKGFYQDAMWGMDFGIGNRPIIQFKSSNGDKPKKGKFMSAVSFVKKQALKATNPDEFELREAGLHNECGELTSEGEELRDQFLEELVKEKMVATARAINEEKKSKK